jgi:hypothetical protein
VGPRSRGRGLQERIGRGTRALLEDGFVGRGEAGPVAQLSLLFIHVMASCLFSQIGFLLPLYPSSFFRYPFFPPHFLSQYVTFAVFYFLTMITLSQSLVNRFPTMPVAFCLEWFLTHLFLSFPFFFLSIPLSIPSTTARCNVM